MGAERQPERQATDLTTPDTPYERQQFHALMAENGVIPCSGAQAAELGERLRTALRTN